MQLTVYTPYRIYLDTEFAHTDFVHTVYTVNLPNISQKYSRLNYNKIEQVNQIS